ncbi:hypothetical protein SLS60_004063 [Paraconiothyrium brasiliense]|uniref:FMN hydroxy acid dehydrogenase domain-containing protein n=1 Tax=Paraconiothyrium brasiliense TaxID=300254 RepID=A0ABR3RRU9_9PLEO
MSDEFSGAKAAMQHEPDPNAFVEFQRDIYRGLRKPAFSTKPSTWESEARRILPEPNFMYIYGAASSESTCASNLSAFERYRLRPWMLVQATHRDLSVELFGQRYKSPILAAPIGVQEIAHHEAEEATARACVSTQVPMILSTAATRSIEQVAKANGDGDRWFQLYWPVPQAEEFTASLLKRAKSNGFKVLVVTLDTFMLGWRPRDLDESYLPFLYGQGCQNGFSDPAFNRLYERLQAEDTRSAMEKIGEIWSILKRPASLIGAAKILANATVMKKSQLFMSLTASGSYSDWSRLSSLKKHWDGPIVLKGIQTVEDTHRAIEYGMDGIIVSNHGGRQLDGAIGSLDALAEIGSDEKTKSSNLTILFDSGVRTGSDVLKAIALGAKAVLIGRPYIYGLAMGGEAGVKHVLNCLLADTDNSLANLGKKSLSEVTRDDLRILQQLAKL